MNKKSMKREEDIIQIHISRYLKLKGFTFTITQGGLYIKSNIVKGKQKAMGYEKGCSDMIVFIPGGCVHIEVKRPPKKTIGKKGGLIISEQGGKQSESQKIFQEKISKIKGHYYLLADSFDKVASFFEENNIKPK